MTGFTEEWLKEHQAKMTALKGDMSTLLTTSSPDVIAFRLPEPFKLLNETLRMHWATRRRYQQKLARDISRATMFSADPMQYASIRIVRVLSQGA